MSVLCNKLLLQKYCVFDVTLLELFPALFSEKRDLCKGQLISERIFDVLNFPKKQQTI